MDILGSPGQTQSSYEAKGNEREVTSLPPLQSLGDQLKKNIVDIIKEGKAFCRVTQII